MFGEGDRFLYAASGTQHFDAVRWDGETSRSGVPPTSGRVGLCERVSVFIRDREIDDGPGWEGRDHELCL